MDLMQIKKWEEIEKKNGKVCLSCGSEDKNIFSKYCRKCSGKMHVEAAKKAAAEGKYWNGESWV